MQGKTLADESINLPVYAYYKPTTPLYKSEPALWILGGIHGEEPAGPQALAENIRTIDQLTQNGVPVVFLPLLNPLGYCRDDRYFNAHRNEQPGQSVTDAEHLLLNLQNPTQPRVSKPNNQYAAAILNWVLKMLNCYPPLLVIDHHEDELDRSEVHHTNTVTYSYAHGNMEIMGPLCQLINRAFGENDFIIQKNGTTRLGERIEEGFVYNSRDGSIDEFFAEPAYFLSGNQIKPAAAAVFAVETTRDNDMGIPLADRVAVHKTIIDLYHPLWKKLID
ncbi:MAG: hypothetical protein ABIH84_02210 [bacterium]